MQKKSDVPAGAAWETAPAISGGGGGGGGGGPCRLQVQGLHVNISEDDLK